MTTRIIDALLTALIGGCAGYLIGKRRRVILLTLDKDDDA